MKKSVLLFVAIIAMCLPASAYTTAVLLDHNGKITTYEADKIQNALEEAVDGDVIYLNEGTYPPFTVKKKITIKGVGEMTYIKGNVVIELLADPIGEDAKLSEPMLEYLHLSGSISVSSNSSPIRGLIIRQCKCLTMVFNSFVYDSIIDRCSISASIYNSSENGLNLYHFAKGLTVMNSLIALVRSTPPDANVTFINCRIGRLYSSGGTIKNSIVNGAGETVSYTQFIYTYLYNTDIGQQCELKNCYNGDSYLSYDSDNIAAQGYLGNDGTIIGPLGGSTPYSLVPATPRVTDGKLSVDSNKRQLNVTLTVSPK